MRNQQTQAKQQPLYRVTFARITGEDATGKKTFSRPKEIGAAWARMEGKQGAVLSLDIIPTDLIDRNGVIFLVPNTPPAHRNGQPIPTSPQPAYQQEAFA